MADVTHNLVVLPRLDVRDGWTARLTEVGSGQTFQYTVYSLADIVELMRDKVCEAPITHVVMRQMKHAGVWNVAEDELAEQDISLTTLE
jgi:hypothetical protein